MFLPFCPIVVRLILGFSADSLVTYWGVAHVCVRTECSVRWVILSWTTVQRYEEKQSVVPLVANLWWKCRQLVAFTCVSIRYKAKKQSIKHGDYCILLNIRQIGGALYIYWTWNCGRIMGAMLGTVKEMNHRGRTPTTVYSFTVLQFYSFHKRFLTFEPIFYI